MTPLTLQELERSVKLPAGEVGQLLKAGFRLWPLPDPGSPMSEGAVATVWLMDAWAALGVLHAPYRLAAMPIVCDIVSTFGNQFSVLAEAGAGPVIRLADRRYLAVLEHEYIDLQDGNTLDRLPTPPIERSIYDIGAIWLQRRKPA